MSRLELRAVLENLKAAGFRTPKTVKPTIDLALKKYGAGMPWSALGAQGDCVKVKVSQWRQRGTWAIVMETRRSFRQPAQPRALVRLE